jgi:hypothetical protein
MDINHWISDLVGKSGLGRVSVNCAKQKQGTETVIRRDPAFPTDPRPLSLRFAPPKKSSSASECVLALMAINHRIPDLVGKNGLDRLSVFAAQRVWSWVEGHFM